MNLNFSLSPWYFGPYDKPTRIDIIFTGYSTSRLTFIFYKIAGLQEPHWKFSLIQYKSLDIYPMNYLEFEEYGHMIQVSCLKRRRYAVNTEGSKAY